MRESSFWHLAQPLNLTIHTHKNRTTYDFHLLNFGWLCRKERVFHTISQTRPLSIFNGRFVVLGAAAPSLDKHSQPRTSFSLRIYVSRLSDAFACQRGKHIYIYIYLLIVDNSSTSSLGGGFVCNLKGRFMCKVRSQTIKHPMLGRQLRKIHQTAWYLMDNNKE